MNTKDIRKKFGFNATKENETTTNNMQVFDDIVIEESPKEYVDYNNDIIEVVDTKEIIEEPPSNINLGEIIAKDNIESTALVGSPLVKSTRPIEPTVLGLSADLQVREVTFNFIESEPINLPPIRDINGKFSEKLITLEDKYKVSVLPLDLCGIPENIIDLKRHRILNINGRKFSDGIDRVVDANKLDKLREVAIQHLQKSIETGTSFRMNITKAIKIKEYTFNAPILNSYETTKFVNDFKNYNPRVYIVSNGDIIIELGVLNAKI